MRLGKDRQGILFLAFLLFPVLASGQTGLSYRYMFEGNTLKSEIIQNNQTIIINYSISELTVKSLTNANGEYYRISIPGHLSSTVQGKPELPVLSRLITVPYGFDYKVRIHQTGKSREFSFLRRLVTPRKPNRSGPVL
jgi:hypothetical protein